MRQTSKEIDKLAKIIWDYHHLNHKLKKSDVIIVLGSHDVRVAEYGAKLFLNDWAPYICFTGGIAHTNDLLSTGWKESEAEKFAQIAINKGVTKNKIILENKAKNTEQNVKFSRKLLGDKNINPKSAIIVQKPYMERRAYATFKYFWPELKIIVASPSTSIKNYPNKEITKDKLINILVGDLQRIKEYSTKGFQIPQKIPNKVWGAYKKLVELGYTKHLINS